MSLDATFRLPPRLLARPDRSATWLFLLLACLVYVPPLFWGKLLVASTDNWFAILPNHLFTAEELRRGGLGLWNPYVLGGIDFAGSTHDFLYSPASWPLFLLPPEWMQGGFHLRVLLETFLLGRFAYAFFREELQSRPAALIAALVTQIGSNAFFSVTTYACLTLYAALYGALAALWTIDRRPLWRTFAATFLAVVLVLTSGNVVYAVGILLVLAVLVAHRLGLANFPRWHRRSEAWVAAGAVLCALAVSAVRLLPVAATLDRGDRMFAGSFQQAFGGHMNDPLMGVTALVPEALGVPIYTAQVLLQRYVWWEPVQHHQIDGHPYAGVATALLIVVALASAARRAIAFWPLLLAVTTVWFLSVRPFAELIWTLFFPWIHGILPRLFVPVAISGALGWALVSLRLEREGLAASRRPALVLSVLAGAGATAVPWIFFVPALARPTGVIVAAAVLGAGVWLARDRRAPAPLPLRAIAGALAAAWLVLCVAAALRADWKDDLFVASFVLVQTGLVALSLLWGAGVFAMQGRIEAARRLCGVAFGLVVLSTLVPLPEGMHIRTSDAVWLAMLGVLRLGLVAALLAWALDGVQAGRASRNAFLVIVGAVLLADLVPVQRELQHVIAEPFWRPEKIEPPRDQIPDFARPAESGARLGDRPDFARWRVNRPHVALGITSVEFQANLFARWGLRSFGGVNSLRDARLSRLVSAFEPAPPFGPGAMTPDLHHPRLLDLLGAGYEADGRARLRSRPAAIGRFRAFARFEVVPSDEDVLARLADEALDPLQTIVLDRDPGISASTARAVDLPFAERTSDEIVVSLDSASPAIVFFGDVYDEGWHALVDGEARPILRANHAFMAVAVPAGARRLELRFRPAALLRGARVALGGGAATLACTVGLALYDARRRSGPGLGR